MEPELVPTLFAGATLTPSEKYNPYDVQGTISLTGNLSVIVAGELEGLPERELAVTLAHELFGHALLYIRNQRFDHPEPEVDKVIKDIESRTRTLLEQGRSQ